MPDVLCCTKAAQTCQNMDRRPKKVSSGTGTLESDPLGIINYWDHGEFGGKIKVKASCLLSGYSCSFSLPRVPPLDGLWP